MLLHDFDPHSPEIKSKLFIFLQMKKMPVSASYSSKPFLFGDGKIPNFTGNKAVGMLDRFEEEKRNAKEKYERYSVHSP